MAVLLSFPELKAEHVGVEHASDVGESFWVGLSARGEQGSDKLPSPLCPEARRVAEDSVSFVLPVDGLLSPVVAPVVGDAAVVRLGDVALVDWSVFLGLFVSLGTLPPTNLFRSHLLLPACLF